MKTKYIAFSTFAALTSILYLVLGFYLIQMAALNPEPLIADNTVPLSKESKILMVLIFSPTLICILIWIIGNSNKRE